ncbi:MAG: hypothetical protein OEV53_12770 [Nitrospira sp.]|nr:hypothetical protein [Nitrospira sp.]MDH5194353.1 hypothetical protein [Nitrospira sp.]
MAYATITPVNRTIKQLEDLRWLIGHTGGFRGGYVTEVQILKRRLFDEGSTREVPAGTTIAVTIHYEVRGLARVAKLTMTGVTDFSVFEQDGIDCSSLSVIQTELNAGKLRFWFDPQGELYVVCDEAHLEELTLPIVTAQQAAELARWTFQGVGTDGPTIQWLLNELDQAGLPCTWRDAGRSIAIHPAVQWEGSLKPADDPSMDEASMVQVMAYHPPEGQGFGLLLRVFGMQDRRMSRILEVLADRITHCFPGNCLVGNTIIPGREWERWLVREHRSRREP